MGLKKWCCFFSADKKEEVYLSPTDEKSYGSNGDAQADDEAYQNAEKVLNSIINDNLDVDLHKARDAFETMKRLMRVGYGKAKTYLKSDHVNTDNWVGYVLIEDLLEQKISKMEAERKEHTRRLSLPRGMSQTDLKAAQCLLRQESGKFLQVQPGLVPR
jgi:hypothetical protein